jgi:leucyl aminopeptidase
MQFQFSQDLPSGAQLLAHVVDQGKLPEKLEPPLREGAVRARFEGKPGQLVEGFVERDGGVVRLALVGAGEEGAAERQANLEKAGAALAAKYATAGDAELVLDMRDTPYSAEETAAIATGVRLRVWRYDHYRTKLTDDEKVTLKSVRILGGHQDSEAAWGRAASIADGVEFARTLVTEPGNVVYPESFVSLCEERFAGTGAKLTVLDEAKMEKLGMGALLGVGRGSERPSRLLAIHWQGGGDEAPIALVGKGVTFDTGGISIKPGPGMEDMKWDMGGGAAVAGAMLALARRGAKANVVGVVGLAENMPDGRAQRPGDVVTSMSGQTIEVINTDAEGRLVLCDALHWTQKEFKPARIVDFATLTGAMIIALGHEHGGVFSNDDALADALVAAGRTTGEKLWRLPLGPSYDKLINSPIADMKNVGPRQAGSITAAQFLLRFIENDTPWAHCDIAGMVWAEKPGHVWGAGATGYGVRLIDRFIADTAEG